MQRTLKRVGAVLLGATALLLALLVSVGAAALVPVGMWIGTRFTRTRQLTPIQAWMAGVLPFGAIVCIALVTATLMNPRSDELGKVKRAMAEAQAARREQPALLRQLNLPSPTPLSPTAEKAYTAVAVLFTVEGWCAFTGTMAWGGVSMLLFGFRGSGAYRKGGPALPAADGSDDAGPPPLS